MFKGFVFLENWTGLGWIALIMCVPVYVVNAFFEFDLKWMTGLPFAFFYFWSLLSSLLIPILLVLQFVVIARFWIKKRRLVLQQVALFLISGGLYGFAILAARLRLFDS